MDLRGDEVNDLLMNLVFLVGLFALIPWFFFALWLWLSSHLPLMRQRRLRATHRLDLLLLVSPTAAWGGLCGQYYLGWPRTSALLSLVGLALAGFLVLAGRLATETAYPCPLCGAERMRLAGPVDADPHSAGGIGGVFRCRVCRNRWLLAPENRWLLASEGRGGKGAPDPRSLE